MNLHQDVPDAGHRGRRLFVPEAVGLSSLVSSQGVHRRVSWVDTRAPAVKAAGVRVSTLSRPIYAAAGGLHGRQELQVRVIRQRRPERPVALEQDDRSPLRVGDAGRSAALLEHRRREGLAFHPSRVLVRQLPEVDRDLVFGLQAVLDHLELKDADRAQDRVSFQPVAIEEELDGPLFRELLAAPS